MAELVNVNSNTIEEVPQDRVQEAIVGGTHNLVKGSPVNVVNPDGQLVSLPAEQVPEALRSNFRIASSQDIAQYEKQQQYEQPVEQLKTFGEAAASGATFGASREAEKYLFDNQAAQKARKEINPNITTAGELTGALGSAILAPELSPVGAVSKVGTGISKAAEKLLVNPETASTVGKIVASAGAKGLGSAVEGSVYGLGNAVSEHALGDADLNAENLMHNVGYGALLGGALGTSLGVAEGAIKGALNKEILQTAAKDTILENAARSSDNPILEVPSSMEDIAQRVKLGKDLGFVEELPQKQVALKANEVLADKSQFPLHEIQLQSLESPAVRDYYKAFLESGSKEAQDLQAYIGMQKRESEKLLKQAVQEISPVSKLTEDQVEGGNKLIKAFTEQYDTEKDALKPLFKEFDKKASVIAKDPEVILSKIDEAVPQASNFIHKSPEGFSIVKYESSMPISKETHSVLKDLVGQLNKENLTLGELRNIREAMRDKVNFLTSPRTANEISSLRKSLMDVIEAEIQQASPDMAVRDTFRRYAINEENRKIMERIFGGSISDKASFAKEIKPEDVLSKLFSNTVAVKAAKDILGSKFDEAAANYLAQNIGKFTDPIKGGFSSNKFASLLKAKAPEIEEALGHKPEQLNSIRAIIDKLRIDADSPSINPSGTAKTAGLLSRIKDIGGYLSANGLIKGAGKALASAAEHFESAKKVRTLNDILAGKNVEGIENKYSRYGVFSKIERLGQDTSRKITSGIRNIFDNSESPIRGISVEKLTPEEQEKKYNRISERIRDMSSNFQTGVDTLESATKPLHNFAPNTSASLNIVAGRATQFLAQKLPAQEQPSAFTEPYKPSPSELSKFFRYYSVVEKPLSVLHQIKDGTLTKESLEALQVVYPKLYNEMQMAVMDQITTKLAKDPSSVPYNTKLMISMFTGNDLVNTLKQSNISNAQQVYAMQGQRAPQKAQSFSKLTKSEQALTPVQKVEQPKPT